MLGVLRHSSLWSAEQLGADAQDTLFSVVATYVIMYAQLDHMRALKIAIQPYSENNYYR